MMINKPVIKGKMDVKFPSKVEAQSPILLDKTGGNFTFGFDVNALGTLPAIFDGIAPTTTRGDLIYRNATINARLPAGTSGNILQTNGIAGDPAWVSVDAVLPTTTRGDLIARAASSNQRLPLGTAGYALLSNGTDPAWTGFVQSGAGAVTRTWQDKARDSVSVFDFMTAAQIADVQARAYTLDVSAAIQAAINSLPNEGGDVYFPRGGYRIQSSINIGNGGAAASTKHGVHLLGQGVNWTTQSFTAAEAPTTFKLFGTAHAGAIILINGPIGGVGISNFGFEFDSGVGSVARAIVDVGCCGGDFRNIRINQPSDFGIIETTSALSPADRNTWTNVYIRLGGAGTNTSASAQGLLITGSAVGGDRFFDSWTNLRIVPSTTTQTCIHLQYCDSIRFDNVEIPLVSFGPPQTFCIPLQFDYSLVANFPNDCTFTHFDPSGGSIINTGTAPGGTNFTNRIYGLLQGNGASVPAIGNLDVINGGNEGAWTSYTPTVTASSGTFTSVSATGQYSKIGKTVNVRIAVTITTNGTAAGAVLATLPFSARAGTSSRVVLAGRDFGSTAKMLQAPIEGSGTSVAIFNYDNSYPGVSGSVLVVSGTYESA